MKELTLLEIASFLKEHDNYIMLTHRRPDGDTIGCAAALCGGLRKLGKRAWVLENPQFTPKYRPFLDGLTIKAPVENAVFVAVDIATQELLPYNATDYVNQIDLRIDHHGRNMAFGVCGYVEPKAAACGEIILELLQTMQVQMDKLIAEALYLAISTDTGCFRYSNVTANTLRAAALCKDCGADTFMINQVMFMTRRFARLKLDAYLADTIELYADGAVAVNILPAQIRTELGITEDDIDDISGFGRQIEGVEIAAMIRQEPEGAKLSVRTSPKYDASEICSHMGGGGHAAAAGATVNALPDEAKRLFLTTLTEMGVEL